MTIEELLEMARFNTKRADSSVGRSNLEFAAVHAAIAQAAALTAQAMMWSYELKGQEQDDYKR